MLLVVNPGNPGTAGLSRFVEGLGPKYGVEIIPASVRTDAEIETAISGFSYSPDRAIIILPDGLTVRYQALTIDLVNRSRVPAAFGFRSFAVNGGLLSWGVEFSGVYQQAATYVDRILRGAKPSDLPVQAPNKFELVINLKTAKALGLTIPPALLSTADEVIE